MARVTVIDDSADILALFRELIEPFHEVHTYLDALAAFDGIKKHRPDVVLLDISLGNVHGVDVLHHIRGQAGLESLPIIAVTTRSQRIERSKFLAEGFTDFVAKPVTDEGVLLSAIEMALRGESSPGLDDDLDGGDDDLEDSSRG